MARGPTHAYGARRFSLAGLLMAVSVAAVLLAPFGTMPRSRLHLETNIKGAVAAALFGLVVGFVVLLRYPQVRWTVRLLGMALGAASASLAAVVCLGHADARMMVGGTAALMVATFGLRLVRVLRHEHQAAAEFRASSPFDSLRE